MLKNICNVQNNTFQLRIAFQKPASCFTEKDKWLVSIWNTTLGWNRLTVYSTYCPQNSHTHSWMSCGICCKIFEVFVTIFWTLDVIRLKIQLCKSYTNKYIIASTQTTNTEIFAFIAVLVVKLWSRKVLFINKKDNRNSNSKFPGCFKTLVPCALNFVFLTLVFLIYKCSQKLSKKFPENKMCWHFLDKLCCRVCF